MGPMLTNPSPHFHQLPTWAQRILAIWGALLTCVKYTCASHYKREETRLLYWLYNQFVHVCDKKIVYIIIITYQKYRICIFRSMQSGKRHLRLYVHPLYPNPTPDVLSCVLPLGAAGRGLESEVDVAHRSLPFIAHVNLFLNTHNNFTTNAPTCIQKSCDYVRVAKQQV